MNFKRILSMCIVCAIALSIMPICYAEDTVAEQTSVMSVTVDGVTSEYESFEEGWVNAVTRSKESYVTVVLHCDWLAGDENNNGVIDLGESTGAFLYKNENDVETGTSSGRLYLGENGANLSIDLNGFTIDRGLSNVTTSGQVFKVENNAHLAILDSSELVTGKVTGGYNDGIGGGFYLEDGGILTLKSGNVINNTAQNGGGVGMNDGCSLYLEGAIIDNNLAVGCGGGIYAINADTFKLESGQIINNSATFGGGISVEETGDTVYNIGEISILNNTAYNVGGGVYTVGGSYKYFDTKINNNRAFVSGGGMATESTSQAITLGGDVQITDNYIKSNDSIEKIASNISLKAEECDLLYDTDRPFSSDAIVGITAEYDFSIEDKITDGAGNFPIDAYTHFKADDDRFIITNKDAGSDAGKDRYRVYLTHKENALFPTIEGYTFDNADYLSDTTPVVFDKENKLITFTIKNTYTRIFENVSLDSFVTFTFSTENTQVVGSNAAQDFVRNSGGLHQVMEEGGSYGLWHIEILPEDGLWADKRPVATALINGSLVNYMDFELAWKDVTKKSQSAPVKMTLYENWIAGDENCDGKLDEGAQKGFKYYNNGDEYGTERGSLYIYKESDITIDLNGYTIDRGSTETNYSGNRFDTAFHIKGKLTIEDSSEEQTGIITGGGYSGVVVTTSAVLTLNSGSISNNKGDGVRIYTRGTIYMNGGSINNNTLCGIYGNFQADYSKTITSIYIHGGEINNNKGKEYYGGGIYLGFNEKATVNLEVKNTLIEGNTGDRAGGLCVYSNPWYGIPYTATVKISDGSIIRNNTGSRCGGLWGNFMNLTITDSDISQNRSYYGYGGVSTGKEGSLTFGGSTRIVDNYTLSETATDESEKKITNLCIMDEEIDIFYDKTHPFTENATIGITSIKKDNEKLSDKNGDFVEDTYTHFFADEEDYTIINKDAGSSAGKNRYQIYYSSKNDKSDIGIKSINVKPIFACSVAPVIDYENKSAAITVKNNVYQYVKSCKLGDIADFEFTESGTSIASLNEFRDFTLEESWLFKFDKDNGQYNSWEISIHPEGGEWKNEAIAAVSVASGDTIHYFPDFESAWICAIAESKENKTTFTLYRDWLAGDTNSNGVIDGEEKTGAFKYYKDGTEYGSKYGALHLATDGIDMVINLNGFKIDRGLSADTSNGNVIRLHNGASLEIRDDSSAKTGVITGGRNGLAGYEGGAVYIADSSSFTLTSGSIINNVSEYGGAVYIKDNGSFTMYGGQISGNTALYGGAIATATADVASKVKIYGGEICNNTATGNGGGIYFAALSSGSSVAFIVENAKIYNNKAHQGGGIFVTSHDDCTAYVRENTAIYDNTATYGGGVYLDMDSRMSFENCRVENNRAYLSGGGVVASEYSNDPIVGGVTYIYGNYVQSEEANALKTPSNFCLDNQECNINNNVSNSISEGSKIGITINYDKESDCFSAGGSKFTATSHKYFLADLKSQMIWDVDSGSGDNRYQLIIANRPEIDEANFNRTEDGISVSAKISGKVYKGIVIVAGYMENALVDVAVIDYGDYSGSTTLEGSFDKAKIVLWKDFITLIPVAIGEDILITE